MKRSNSIFLILAVLISSIGILSLFRPGFFLTDDGNSMVIRFSAFYEALRSGQFPVRFLSRLSYGYGYPVADFLYPLFMYLGVPIHAIGFSFVSTIKIILGLGFLSGTVFSYLWLRKLFDEKAALVGAVAYSLFPYHLFDIYKRGSVGEILAFGIVPFILWAIERKNIVLVSLGFALLITSHNSLAMLFIPIILLYQLLSGKKVSNILASLFWGLGLSAFFWIPALYDKQFTIFDATKVSDYKDYFINSQALVLAGLVFFVAVIFGAFHLFKRDKKLYFFLSLSLISFFMTLPASEVIWGLLPLASLVQFPFRFLSLTTLGVAFLLSYFVFHYKGKIKTFFIVFLLSVIFISARGFFVPETFQNYPDTFYSTNQDSTTVKNEYMPKWVRVVPSKMASSRVENLSGKEKVNITKATASKLSFEIFLAKPRTIQVNIIYFPGWVAYVNGKEVNINYNNPRGLIHLDLKKGKNDIMVEFKETPVRLFGDLISIVSLLVLLAYLINKKRLKI